MAEQLALAPSTFTLFATHYLWLANLKNLYPSNVRLLKHTSRMDLVVIDCLRWSLNALEDHPQLRITFIRCAFSSSQPPTTSVAEAAAAAAAAAEAAAEAAALVAEAEAAAETEAAAAASRSASPTSCVMA